MPLLDDYYTDPEFAREMGVKTRTTKSWRDNRTGPPVTFIAGRPRYRKEAVRQWLLAREIDLSKRARRRGAA
ncbi:MAG TPA: hypothetical protein ENI68_00855 [Gammaproteobacteria bacterium]|nr:hypothetical protein [Gammaproteobacteria bacterium]